MLRRRMATWKRRRWHAGLEAVRCLCGPSRHGRPRPWTRACSTGKFRRRRRVAARQGAGRNARISCWSTTALGSAAGRLGIHASPVPLQPARRHLACLRAKDRVGRRRLALLVPLLLLLVPCCARCLVPRLDLLQLTVRLLPEEWQAHTVFDHDTHKDGMHLCVRTGRSPSSRDGQSRGWQGRWERRPARQGGSRAESRTRAHTCRAGPPVPWCSATLRSAA